MKKRALVATLSIALLLSLIVALFGAPLAVASTGATTEVYVVKLAEDGTTVLAETTVSYEWMEENLPVQGDGVTHYYHQGPVFEGDKWDPEETANPKDKGAVKGTDIKDLCELVGGMSPGDDVMIHAVDGYHTEYGYTNVYEPQDKQGPIVLCWYNGEDALIGERYGEGYPGTNSYRTAMQIVFMAKTKNPDGNYIFGNSDMRECLPEQSQHFYEIYASTNGLSVKWVDEIRVYTGGYTGERGAPAKAMPTENDDTSGQAPWAPIAGGVAGGVLVIGLGVYLVRRRTGESEAE